MKGRISGIFAAAGAGPEEPDGSAAAGGSRWNTNFGRRSSRTQGCRV